MVAGDFSPRRRELAKAVGADIVIDPKDVSPFTSWHEAAAVKDPARAQRLSPWTPFPARRPALIFECVGVPGMIESVMAAAPPQARIVVVGLCMENEHFLPVNGIMKELNLQEFPFPLCRKSFPPVTSVRFPCVHNNASWGPDHLEHLITAKKWVFSEHP